METGDRVEIKEASGTGWKWTGCKGRVTNIDRYCFTVRTDDGKDIRDVREHFRLVQ